MKYSATRWAAAAMICLSLAGCGQQDQPAGDNGGETYTVATDNGFVPFEFVDSETGELVGFDIELMRAVADEAGFNVDFQTMDFDGLIAGMQSGRFDMGIAGITITEERDKTIDFSDPYYDAGLIIAVSADNTTIQSEDDLAGKQVGTRTGTTSEAYLKANHPDAEIVAFPGIVEAYMELQSGRVDAVLYDVPNVRYYVNKDAGGKLKTVGDVLQGEQYGIAFPEDSPLVERVNEALATLKQNGTYDQIHAKWFGK